MAPSDDNNESQPLLRPRPISRSSVRSSGSSIHKKAPDSFSSSLPTQAEGSIRSIDVPDDDSEAALGDTGSGGPPRRSLEDDALPEEPFPLGRTLGWPGAYVLVISRVIGSGIFATPGAVARAAGSPGLALVLWLVGGLVAAAGLSVSLEYGAALPRSGGDKVYLEFTYRRPRFLASTIVAVYVVCLGFTASNCVVFAEYVLFACRVAEPSDVLRKGLAVGLLTAITVVHGCFRPWGIRIQNVLGWVKVAMVGFMVLAGAYVVIFGRQNVVQPEPRPGPSPGRGLWDDLWAGSNWSWAVISTAFFKVFYSYAGLENLNNVMSEVRDPVRTLKSVATTAVVTACALYLLINLAYFAVVPMDEIKASGELIAALFFERAFGSETGGKILPLAVALSAASNVMVVVFTASRVKQEIARQGFLPFSELLSSTKPFNSPLGGLIVHFIPSFLVIVLPPSREVYSFILEVEGYPAQFFSIAICAGLIWLRFRRPDLHRPFKAWIPAAVLRILLALALLAAPFFPPKTPPESGMFYATYAIVGISILVFAVLYWYVWTVLLPWFGGYKLEEEVKVLDDGTSITKLVRVPL